MGATKEQETKAVDLDYERPIHQVTLSDYYIGETEVTQELWQSIIGDKPSVLKESGHPVENVTWDECQEFIRKLNVKTGQEFRLPTEAEWKFAARGGIKTRGYKYSGSDKLNKVAWFYDNYDNSRNKTHNVKTKRPNELDIYDMSGNVWEWTQDWMGNYSPEAQTNPTGPSDGTERVFRGGSCFDGAWNCRVSYRYADKPDSRFFFLGMRLAM